MSECLKNCASCAAASDCADRAPADSWLEKIDAMVKELHGEGNFCCSQTVLAIGMKRLGLDDPDLLRAMAGYCGGSCAGVCGALAGGEALIGLYVGRGTPEPDRDPRQKQLAAELSAKFRDYWKSTQCDDLVHGDPKLREYTCPSLMAATVEMAWGILHENGFNLDTREAH